MSLMLSNIRDKYFTYLRKELRIYMANPAPTINQINAFNATQGTIIDFNIIGGTELVRSNKIYIYDLSDNSLICTHLYVSTESIHELPANTDGSIVYESGKSSADFVNGKQYYAQIQTFTNIAGTQGGSGLSVSKLFWCLVDPSLTINTIPSSISTTSYNVSATYNANTSVVSNIIQQYQFNLYSATSSLLQSSGVIVGNGTQQGTSTTYNISYNFSGLSVGNSYYVVVDVTTTQGMSISAQSGTFTVNIDTPTLGEATVVNNACDGYISVTSNLSSQHSANITNILVKRQDVDDVSGQWLILYSQPITQASDMNFTFIDFLNQYDKTYKYALVPLLTQTQSGVEVEVEGGYTVSDEVQSIFDGVYIGDSTGVQRLKAGVAYNNLNTNQQVGVIPTLGNKYPIIVSNSNIQYDTGSVSGLIVPDDFYSNGNLSRLDMSSKREAINDFLTNKKPKILKDWNGNIWLVVFTDNVDVSFDDNYGMGVATFTSGWTEVGDPTNQEDLQRTGLINVGGD